MYRRTALTRSDMQSLMKASTGSRRKKRDRSFANRLGVDESQALPTVIKIDGKYHMFFLLSPVFRLQKKQKTEAIGLVMPILMT